MGLFDTFLGGTSALFKGFGNALGGLFKTPIGGGGTLGGALLAPVVTAGVSRLVALTGGEEARQRRSAALAPFVGVGTVAPAPIQIAAGREFATPGDLTTRGGFMPLTGQGFLPGVVGSGFASAVPALAGAARGVAGILGRVLRSPGGQIGVGVGGALGLESLFGDDEAAGLFRPTMAGVRAIPIVMRVNPVTGSPTFWRHVGRPLLFAGDLTTAKRVRKVARLAARKR